MGQWIQDVYLNINKSADHAHTNTQCTFKGNNVCLDKQPLQVIFVFFFQWFQYPAFDSYVHFTEGKSTSQHTFHIQFITFWRSSDAY